MPKQKPVHPIFNNRWKPVIDFIADTLCVLLDVLFDIWPVFGGSFTDSATQDDRHKRRKRRKKK